MYKNIINLFIAIFIGSIIFSGCGEQFVPGYNKKTYGNIKIYKERLEHRLLYQYKNHPLYGKKVAKVVLDVVKDIKSDTNNQYRKVEFSQLVYDIWGDRIPTLEKEFFVVTFGPPSQQKISMPGKEKISVGLQTRGSYSEYTPVKAGVVGKITKLEHQNRGSFCPICGNRISKDGVCFKCLNQNGKKTKNDSKVSSKNSPLFSNDKFTQNITKQIKSDLKQHESQKIISNKNQFNDLKTISVKTEDFDSVVIKK